MSIDVVKRKKPGFLLQSFRKLRFNCKGLVPAMKTMSLQVTEHIKINVSYANSICVKKSLDSEEKIVKLKSKVISYVRVKLTVDLSLVMLMKPLSRKRLVNLLIFLVNFKSF